MKQAIKALDDLPWIVKLILCIPALDIVWSVYKLLRSLVSKNVVYIILGILVIFPGAAFIWIVDIITMLLGKKIWWFC